MIFENNYKVGIRDVIEGRKATNKAILSYMENAACMHSDKVGYGINDIPKTKLVWILLDWRVKIINRPSYGDEILVKTWSKGMEKCYAYREFELLDSKENIIAIASTKWVLTNCEKGKIVRVDETIQEAYPKEEKCVFDLKELEKIFEPENEQNITEYKIRKTDIDINGHVNNLNYLDIAYEGLPLDIKSCQEFENIRITYKHETKLGETVKVLYTIKEDKHIIVIKSNDEKILHSIVELW